MHFYTMYRQKYKREITAVYFKSVCNDSSVLCPNYRL